MISKRKNNGKTVYCLDLRDSGYGRKFFKTKEAAQDYWDQQAKQLLGVREGRDKKTDWTFDQLLDVFIEHLENVGKNAHNKIRTMHEIRGIKVDGTKLCTMRVRDFVVGDVDGVVEAINKGRSRKTVLEYMGHFRMLLDYAVRKGVISVNVFTQLPNGLVIEGAEKKFFCEGHTNIRRYHSRDSRPARRSVEGDVSVCCVHWLAVWRTPCVGMVRLGL